MHVETGVCGKVRMTCKDFCEMYGEEMSRYTMELVMKKWVEPSIDTSKWEYYDLSCKAPQRLDSSSLRLCVLPGNPCNYVPATGST